MLLGRCIFPQWRLKCLLTNPSLRFVCFLSRTYFSYAVGFLPWSSYGHTVLSPLLLLISLPFGSDSWKRNFMPPASAILLQTYLQSDSLRLFLFKMDRRQCGRKVGGVGLADCWAPTGSQGEGWPFHWGILTASICSFPHVPRGHQVPGKHVLSPRIHVRGKGCGGGGNPPVQCVACVPPPHPMFEVSLQNVHFPFFI